MNKNLFVIVFVWLLFSFKKDSTTIKYSSIIEKYKGKVIYVDMWASWCTPCRKEIKKMKSIKDKYNYKEIVFL